MTDKLNFAKRKTSRREAGFSLIELLISIMIFLIFMSAVYGLLRVANIQRTTVSSQTEVTTNLRLSLNTLGRDAINAGLGYGRGGGNMPDNLTNSLMAMPADVNSTQDVLTAVIAGDDINENDLLPDGERTDVITFAYRDMNFNLGNPIGIINAAGIGTGGVVLTTTPDGLINTPDGDTPYNLYLISNGTRTTVALATGRPDNSTLRFETGSTADILGINAAYTGAVESRSRLFNCADQATTSTDPCMNYSADPVQVTAKKINWVSYEVTQDGTLTRTSYGNNSDGTGADQIQVQPLAYNIQNLQVRYLMRDGSSLENPSNDGANPLVLNEVVQVEVTISARINVRDSGVNLERLVDLKSTFSTRNLNYN